MKLIFYLLFIHIFFFNTCVAINIQTINKYVEEYNKWELDALFDKSDVYFAECNKKDVKQDDEMRLIAIAQVITIKSRGEDKAQLPPSFDDQIKEEIDKIALMYKLETYNYFARINSGIPDSMHTFPDKNDIEIFPYNLKKYVKISPKQYHELSRENIWESGYVQPTTEFKQKSASIGAARIIIESVLRRFFSLRLSARENLIDDTWQFFNKYKKMSLSALNQKYEALRKEKNERRLKPYDTKRQREELDYEYAVQLEVLLFLKTEKEHNKNNPSAVQEKKDPVELKTIKNIKKMIATPGRLLFQLKNEQYILIFSNDVFEEKNISKVKNNQCTLSDISAYGNSYMYAYSTKNGSKSASYIASNWRKNPDVYAHESPIKNLFFDGEFAVSHSEENNIRFFDYEDIAVHNKKEILKKAEYKALRLICYKNRCLIVEEGVSFFGIPLFNKLYIKYVDKDAKIITQKKIATYNVGQCFSFLGDIDNQGNAIIYDQCKKSLTVYTNSKDNIITPINYPLPEGLKKHAPAKQIHYLNAAKIINNTYTRIIKKIILVYDDLIHEITVDDKNKISHKKVFSIEKQSKTIFTTTSALAPFSPKEPYQKNILSIILEDKMNASQKYDIKEIDLD